MDQNTFSYFATQGVFAVITAFLAIYIKSFTNRIMNENKERETKLQDTLGKFADKYDIVITELRDIKNKMK